MKKIPLNSLIFLVDVTSYQVVDRFQPHEFLSVELIKRSLMGNIDRPDLKDLLFTELERLIFLKLSLGQRVVVDAPEMKRDARVNMARAAVNKGHSVFYIVDDLNVRRDIARGDRVAEVIDLNQTPSEVVFALPDEGMFAELQRRGFSGVTVAADIHGVMNALRNAASWARSRNHFLYLLGDVLDYGLDTLEVVEEVYQMVVRGEAEAVMGNHERKIFRYLAQMKATGSSHMRLSHGNRVTIDRIESLSKFDQERWLSRFNALVHLMRNHRISDGFIFAHGAVSPEMWQYSGHRLPSELENMTLFGEVDDSVKRADNFPNRVYNWVDQLAPDQTAIVGHDIRSDFKPLEQVGKLGGKAIFLDTGCGKGGHLSTLDIRFGPKGPRIENFNVH